MKKIVLILFIAAGIISCKGKAKQDSGSQGETKNVSETSANGSKDTAEIKKTIMDFYTWYNSNYAKLEDFSLYQGKRPPYKMNWTEVEKMHSFMRDSMPDLGDEFIKNQTAFLHKCDSAFKVDVNDDVPYGFDWDWYTNSQEDPQYLFDEIKKSNKWLITINGDHATADIRGTMMDNGQATEASVIKLELGKEKNVWKISKIGTE